MRINGCKDILPYHKCIYRSIEIEQRYISALYKQKDISFKKKNTQTYQNKYDVTLDSITPPYKAEWCKYRYNTMMHQELNAFIYTLVAIYSLRAFFFCNVRAQEVVQFYCNVNVIPTFGARFSPFLLNVSSHFYPFVLLFFYTFQLP